MIGKVFERMSNVKDTATKTELVLINKFQSVNKNELIYMSISDLAEILGVAESTILRFCRKLDYKGFQDFKLNLSQDLAVEHIDTHDKIKNLMNDMCDAIVQTSEHLVYDECVEAAKKILAARKVCFFGVGNSSLATMAAKMRLMKVGINVENSSDSHIQSIIASNLDERDIVVLVSVSGGTKDIINIAEIANKNKTPVIVLTNYNKSPLAKKCQYLFVSSKKEAPYDGGKLATVVAQLYIIDLLCSAICELLGNEAAERTIKSSMEVSSKSL